ncbi:hypothetical protein ACO0LG_08570 [Undibacterium sp. Ji42W]|uniref:hypothetical protein n=1 Tax=Undibacterium sp. Ji42W TaxID=3413039 RepID=UPI003BEF6549
MSAHDKNKQHKTDEVHSRLARIESRLVHFMLSVGIDPGGQRLDKPAQPPAALVKEKE